MDAAFISTVPLLMAAAIDPSLLQDHSPWSQRACAILDDMSARGNVSARLIRSELKQLDDGLSQLLTKGTMAMTLSTTNFGGLGQGSEPVGTVPPVAAGGYNHFDFAESFGQHYELSPGQLMELANSLDLNSLTWPLSSLGDMSSQSI